MVTYEVYKWLILQLEYYRVQLKGDPRFRELASHDHRESGGGIHAT